MNMKEFTGVLRNLPSEYFRLILFTLTFCLLVVQVHSGVVLNSEHFSTASVMNSSTTYWPIVKVYGGGRGYSEGKLYDPMDVAIGLDERVYVVEAYNNRIQVFNMDGSVYKSYLLQDCGGVVLDEPRSVAVVERETNFSEIVVADTMNHQIQVLWVNRSQSEEQVNCSYFGEKVSYDDYRPSLRIYFEKPSGVDVDMNGTIYVADTGFNRIQVFRSADYYRLPKAANRSEINGTAAGGGGVLTTPKAVAYNKGRVYIADTGSHRIRVFNLSGVQLLSIGSYGSGRGEFNNPEGVEADDNGYIYVSDTGNNRVVVYDSEGLYVHEFGSRNCSSTIRDDPEKSPEQFCSPRGLEVYGDILYVVDSGNHRVLSYNITGFPESQCILRGDVKPCNVVELAEVLEFISLWSVGLADLSEVLDLITIWAVS